MYYSDNPRRERGISMTNAHLRLVTPTGEIPTVTPRRGKNTEYRTREHLTEAEVERLIEATTSHRDATMILLGYRHGLRASELVDPIRSISSWASCTSAKPRAVTAADVCA
jgi:integrase